MEGKELYNEDDELNPKSDKEEDDSDNFGLPDIDDESEKSDELGDPFEEDWNDKDQPVVESDSLSDDLTGTDPDTSYDYSDEQQEPEEEEQTYKSSYYEEDYHKKKSPVGWIIAAVVALIVIIIAVFWWMNREPRKEVVVTPPVIERPVVKEPEPIVQKEPEPVREPVKQAGVFEMNQPTGRYHVIVASSIDKDLVRDYGNILAKKGMTCNILAPRGNKKFHRLSVADFVSLNDAAIRSEQLKGEFGDEVWVIRY